MLSPTENVELKDFSKLLSDYSLLFKAGLISKDFSRKPFNSSTFQACANPTTRKSVYKTLCSQLYACPWVSYYNQFRGYNFIFSKQYFDEFLDFCIVHSLVNYEGFTYFAKDPKYS